MFGINTVLGRIFEDAYYYRWGEDSKMEDLEDADVDAVTEREKFEELLAGLLVEYKDWSNSPVKHSQDGIRLLAEITYLLNVEDIE